MALCERLLLGTVVTDVRKPNARPRLPAATRSDSRPGDRVSRPSGRPCCPACVEGPTAAPRRQAQEPALRNLSPRRTFCYEKRHFSEHPRRILSKQAMSVAQSGDALGGPRTGARGQHVTIHSTRNKTKKNFALGNNLDLLKSCQDDAKSLPRCPSRGHPT